MPIPKKEQVINRMSAKEQIYRTLREWIVDGTMKPGEHINDIEIAQYFSVSRTPVREALMLLAEENLVEVIPSRGTKVAMADCSAAYGIYEALAEISGSAAKLACRKQKPGDIEKLNKLNKAFQDAVERKEYTKLSGLDDRFHGYIFQMADNVHLKEFAEKLTVHAYRYENLYYLAGEDKTESVREHENLIRAMETGDDVLAGRCAEENWLGFYERRLKNLL